MHRQPDIAELGNDDCRIYTPGVLKCTYTLGVLKSILQTLMFQLLFLKHPRHGGVVGDDDEVAAV